MAWAVKDADNQFMRRHAFFGGDRGNIFRNSFVQIDDVWRIARPDGDLVHVDIGGVEQIALFGHGEHGQRVRASLCCNGGAFQRIKGDINFWASANGRANLFTDKQHRRFVPLAFANDHGAVHIQLVQGGAHRFDGGGIRCLLIATSDQFRRCDSCSFRHPHHFQNKDPVEDLACCSHLDFLAI